jgi:hypothetical protein
MTFAGIALKLLFGGLGLLKKLFAALLRIQLPAIVPSRSSSLR